MQDIFQLDPLVIAALHLPYGEQSTLSLDMHWLEDYVLQNMRVFVEAGIPAVILQDETLNAGRAWPETVATMAVLGHLARSQFPDMQLGIIVQAHDPVAPLVIANAADAAFVRIKVYVGAMVKADGVQVSCGVEARNCRAHLGREDIKILADVHDRTGIPLGNVPLEMAAGWAVTAGADALILAGVSHEESMERIRRVRSAGIGRPLILGGGAHEGNIAQALEEVDGVIVSSALKREHLQPGDIVRWDRDKVNQFMDAARSRLK